MKPIGEKLLGIFREEHREHAEQIRLLIDRIRQAECPGADLDEAFRRAHSLKGAARAVDIGEIESLGHRLETLFARVREGGLCVDTAVADVVHDALDCSEDILANLPAAAGSAATLGVLAAIDRILAAGSPADRSAGASMEEDSSPPQNPSEVGRAAPAGRTSAQSASFGPCLAAGTVEEAAEPALAGSTVPETPARDGVSVRLRAMDVSGLLRTCDQLLSAVPRNESLTSAARHLAREVDALAHEWDRLGKTCSSQLRRLSSDPEFRRLHRLMEEFEMRLRRAPGYARRLLRDQQRAASDSRQLVSRLRIDVWKARLIPAETVFEGFGNMVRSLARAEDKQVRFRAAGLETEADRDVLRSLRDPVMHLLRNAVSHGIESTREREEAGKPPEGQVTLSLEALAGRLSVRVSDDGRGIDFARVAGEARRRGLLPEGPETAEQRQTLRRIIFTPGFSTSASVSEISGRGMGLSVVEQSLRRLQGEIETSSEPGQGTVVVLRAPLSVLMQPVLLVAVAERVFAIPLRSVEQVGCASACRMEMLGDQFYVRLKNESIRAVSLAATLGMASGNLASGAPFMVVRNATARAAFFVDRLLEEREALVKDLNVPQERGSVTAGGVLLENQTIAVVLDVPELLLASETPVPAGALQPSQRPPEGKKHRILLADDSVTTRALERSILEVHGYDVLAAVDGVEALQMLRTQGADLVISDVQMPRMDGFALLQAIKDDKRLARIPVIILTSMERPEEQEKGLALGADAYIVKRKFDQRELLETIRQIL